MKKYENKLYIKDSTLHLIMYNIGKMLNDKITLKVKIKINNKYFDGYLLLNYDKIIIINCSELSLNNVSFYEFLKTYKYDTIHIIRFNNSCIKIIKDNDIMYKCV